MNMASCYTSLLLLIVLSLASHARGHDLQLPDPVSGLAYDFYAHSCPHADRIVREAVQSFLTPNISQAGSLVRLVFHDCFVQGCDASVLLNGTDGEEQTAPPNLTLRPEALALIEKIKENLAASCPNTVSCADVVVMAGREASCQAGGQYFKVPTGRLDSLNSATTETTQDDLPSPRSNISTLLDVFQKLGLNATDLVALSGAHTIGLAHCGAFNDSILPIVRPGLDTSFANTLLQVCPNSDSNAETTLDPVTPNAFDNQYFKNLMNGEVLLDSDRALLDDATSAATVAAFAASQAEFFKQYSVSFVKMSMLNVRTSSTGNGNIRQICSVLNPTNATVSALDAMYCAEDTVFSSTCRSL